MCDFEKKVKNNIDNILKNYCQSKNPLMGLAVSGGADSISLLLSLSRFFSPLYVITVNHNIRPAEESHGDAAFVQEICKKLCNDGQQIFCELIEFEKGKVEEEAWQRGGGIEEAARSLRYAAFESFAKSHKLDALCLAHNQNDQLETILMRFMQGSSVEVMAGIRESRMLESCKCLLARPLLNISRSEIEAYVTERGFTWRTDKTNFDTDYLRNKIRLKLLPFLNDNFTGWQTALLAGAEKASEDANLIQGLLSNFQYEITNNGTIKISLSDFLKAPFALKYRILLEACNRAGESSRIPHSFLKDVISALENASEISLKSSFSKHYGSIDISCEKNNLFIKKSTENNTDLFFSDIIDKTGTFEFPFGLLNVFDYKEKAGKAYVSVSARKEGENCEKSRGTVVEGVSLPFYVRSIAPGDTLISADGSEKKASDILSDWHVTLSERSLLPVIQLLDERPQRIKALLAGFLGYKDWIVKL